MKRIARPRKQKLPRARSTLFMPDGLETIQILSNDISVQNMCDLVHQETSRSGWPLVEGNNSEASE